MEVRVDYQQTCPLWSFSRSPERLKDAGYLRKDRPGKSCSIADFLLSVCFTKSYVIATILDPVLKARHVQIGALFFWQDPKSPKSVPVLLDLPIGSINYRVVKASGVK